MTRSKLEPPQQKHAAAVQSEVDKRLKHNLALFKQRFPTIFKRIEKHQPQKVVLNLDSNGNLNLVDTEIREYFYHGDPKAICSAQVRQFKSKIQLKAFRLEKADEYNPGHLHIKHLNKMIDCYQASPAKRIAQTPATITHLLLSGIGAGHHLIALVEQFDIHNLFIYENCLDTFHCSLHTIDWSRVLDNFERSHRTITFCLGVPPERALDQIERSINLIGFHNLIFTFVYKHTQRPCEQEFIDTFTSQIQSHMGGLGFFDDEQIGFAHGVANVQAEHPVLISPKTFHRKTPLMIVANGPSLDLHQDYIKRNKDNAIIISCGTALGSLLRLGIKPDFHVEMERAAVVREFMDLGSTGEQRSGITLLCLHTVSPSTISAFDRACMALKASDAGSHFLQNYFLPQKLAQLVFCNPTVANCALSFAVSMGFMKIHLIGVDLGVRDDGQHHSKNSVYYDIENSARPNADQNKTFTHAYSGNDLYCEGNFGGKIRTHNILDKSRVTMGRLLTIITKAFPEFQCINTNHGAKIKYATPVALHDLKDLANCDKQAEIKSVIDNHFHQKKPSDAPKDMALKHLDYFFSLKEKLYLNVESRTDAELLRDMNRVYRLISVKQEPTTNILLRGSINCFFGAIIEHSLYCATTEETRRHIQLGAQRYNEFIRKVFERMEEDPLRLDDTSNALVIELKRARSKQ